MQGELKGGEGLAAMQSTGRNAAPTCPLCCKPRGWSCLVNTAGAKPQNSGCHPLSAKATERLLIVLHVSTYPAGGDVLVSGIPVQGGRWSLGWSNGVEWLIPQSNGLLHGKRSAMSPGTCCTVPHSGTKAKEKEHGSYGTWPLAGISKSITSQLIYCQSHYSSKWSLLPEVFVTTGIWAWGRFNRCPSSSQKIKRGRQ